MTDVLAKTEGLVAAGCDRRGTAGGDPHSPGDESRGPGRPESRASGLSATRRWSSKMPEAPGAGPDSKPCGRTCATARECCSRLRALPPSRCSRWPSASAPIRPSSAWSTRSSSGSCRSKNRTGSSSSAPAAARASAPPPTTLTSSTIVTGTRSSRASSATSQRALTLSDGGQAERIQGMIVSGNYFTVLRVRPALGRGFLPEEDKTAGTHPVVVIGYGLWQRRFGADPGLVGKTVSLNGYPFTVVGIAPPEFNGTIAGGAPDVYVPLMMMGQIAPSPRSDLLFGPRSRSLSGWLQVLGRLKPGVSARAGRSRHDAPGKPDRQSASQCWMAVRESNRSS